MDAGAGVFEIGSLLVCVLSFLEIPFGLCHYFVFALFVLLKGLAGRHNKAQGVALGGL